MKVPVRGRNAPLLPIHPTRVIFDRVPHLLSGERKTTSQAFHGAGDVHANQDLANIKDDSAELGVGHGLVALRTRRRAGAALSDSTELTPGAIDADDRGKHGNDYDHGNNVMDALTDVWHRAPK